MEALLKENLGYKTCKGFGGGGGGCISDGQGYQTDRGRVFVKVNKNSEARRMFDGEYASLEAIRATTTMRCPEPIQVIDNPGQGAVFVMEYLDMTSLHSKAAQLGQQLANMHLHNTRVREKVTAEEASVHRDKDLQFVDKFGFDVTTCCGYLPQDNSWESSWPEFYARRLDQQLSLIEQKHGDREARQLWSELQRKIPGFFKDVDIVPALVHGDLWSGNVAQNEDGPIIFDPASFYAHHEFELGIASMFGGFSQAFWSSYHDVIPKTPGWEKRNQLYQLFNYINHWNHFGSSYRGSSVSLMKTLSR